jgi:hypothetical protein
VWTASVGTPGGSRTIAAVGRLTLVASGAPLLMAPYQAEDLLLGHVRWRCLEPREVSPRSASGPGRVRGSAAHETLHASCLARCRPHQSPAQEGGPPEGLEPKPPKGHRLDQLVAWPR